MVRVIIRHLVGIGNNLNQIAHKVNSGVISHQRMDIPYLNTIYSQVQNLKKAFRYYLNITRKRFVVMTNYEILNDNLQSAR